MRAAFLLVLAACQGSQASAPPPPPPVTVDVTPAVSAPAEVQPTPNAQPYVERERPAPVSSGTGLAPSQSSKPYTAPTQPIDRAAAARALAAVPIQACVIPNGPSGPGHVTVTFEPTGNVSSAAVDAPPYAGTVAGQCLAMVYGGAWVKPFAGAPVKIGMIFSLP